MERNVSAPGTRRGFRNRLGPGFWRGFISGIVALVALGGLLGLLVIGPQALKHREAFPGEEGIGAWMVSAAVPGDYKNRSNPVPASPENLARGKQIYTSNCSICHGITGQGDAPMGRNMFPKAANLLEKKTVDKTDGELYWIGEQGLSFVGMPAFKGIISDEDIWRTVHYMRALQKGTAGTVGLSAALATPLSTAATTAAPAQTTAYAATTAPARATTAAPAPPATTAPPAAGGDNAARGLALFQKNGCTGCHGGDKATGGQGPALNNINYPFEGLLRQLRTGGGGMPPYPTSEVSDADARLIYEYLQTLKP